MLKEVKSKDLGSEKGKWICIYRGRDGVKPVKVCSVAAGKLYFETEDGKRGNADMMLGKPCQVYDSAEEAAEEYKKLTDRLREGKRIKHAYRSLNLAIQDYSCTCCKEGLVEMAVQYGKAYGVTAEDVNEVLDMTTREVAEKMRATI